MIFAVLPEDLSRSARGGFFYQWGAPTRHAYAADHPWTDGACCVSPKPSWRIRCTAPPAPSQAHELSPDGRSDGCPTPPILDTCSLIPSVALVCHPQQYATGRNRRPYSDLPLGQSGGRSRVAKISASHSGTSSRTVLTWSVNISSRKSGWCPAMNVASSSIRTAP
jgi:hypothetical protein